MSASHIFFLLLQRENGTKRNPTTPISQIYFQYISKLPMKISEQSLAQRVPLRYAILHLKIVEIRL